MEVHWPTHRGVLEGGGAFEAAQNVTGEPGQGDEVVVSENLEAKGQKHRGREAKGTGQGDQLSECGAIGHRGDVGQAEVVWGERANISLYQLRRESTGGPRAVCYSGAGSQQVKSGGAGQLDIKANGADSEATCGDFGPFAHGAGGKGTVLRASDLAGVWARGGAGESGQCGCASGSVGHGY